MTENEITIQQAIDFAKTGYQLETALATLGKQLDMIEQINTPKDLLAPPKRFAAKTAEDFKKKALDFLKKFGENIVKELCRWWTENKDKVAKDETLIAAITPVLAGIIPQPWGAIAGIVAIIAVILFKAGMNTICPTGKGKAVLPWK